MNLPGLFNGSRLAAKLGNQKPAVDFQVFATMCIHRHVDPEAFNSLSSLLMCPNPKFILSKRRGDALICRSRSMEATRFLNDKKSDVLFFFDDDIIFDPLDAVKMARLVHDEGLDIVGGPYVLKQDGGGHLTTKLLKDNKEVLLSTKRGEVKEVRAVATGFMAIHRRVIEKMAETRKICVAGDTGFYYFFIPEEREIDGKNFALSEDWAFCERARDLGFKVWLDCSIKLKHAGRYVYDWDEFKRPKKEVSDEILYRENIPG